MNSQKVFARISLRFFETPGYIIYWKVERSSSANEGLLTNFLRSLTEAMRFLRK